MNTDYRHHTRNGASRNGSERFAVIPRRIFELGLSPGAFMLYAALALHANGGTVCCPTQDTLARTLGVSTRCVRRHMAELKRAGVVISERRRYTNVYRLLG